MIRTSDLGPHFGPRFETRNSKLETLASYRTRCRMVATPSAMMLPPNMIAIAQAAYRNIRRARSGFTATSVPRMCHTTASFGQASTHAPHFMHDIRVSPRAIDSSVSDIVGQLFWHSRHGVQRVPSILTSNTLVLLKIDWNAPKGQKKAH